MNCLLCDYQNALKVLSAINLSKKNQGLYTRVNACHITLYYYLGFTYLVTKRYAEAIRAFSTILSFVSHSERQTRSYQHKEVFYTVLLFSSFLFSLISCLFLQILKKSEQICSLLALALALAPQQVDYHVHQLLQEKSGDKLAKLNQLFVFSSPDLSPPFSLIFFFSLTATRKHLTNYLPLLAPNLSTQILPPPNSIL